MKLIKLVWFDLTRGLRQERAKFILTAIIAFGCSWLMSFQYDSYLTVNNLSASPDLSIMDFILYNFRGMKIYSHEMGGEYKFPAVWLIYQVVIALIVGYYPVRDLSGYGKNTLLRTKSRARWFLSKILWTISMVLVYYSVIYIATIIFCFVSGNSLSFMPTHQATLLFCEIDITQIYVSNFIMYLVFMPILTSIVVSIVQVVLSYLLGSFTSFIAVSIFMVASTYETQPWLVGNASMIVRSKFYTPQGLSAEESLIWLGIYLLVALLIGFIYFKNVDILKKER